MQMDNTAMKERRLWRTTLRKAREMFGEVIPLA